MSLLSINSDDYPNTPKRPQCKPTTRSNRKWILPNSGLLRDHFRSIFMGGHHKITGETFASGCLKPQPCLKKRREAREAYSHSWPVCGKFKQPENLPPVSSNVVFMIIRVRRYRSTNYFLANTHTQRHHKIVVPHLLSPVKLWSCWKTENQCFLRGERNLPPCVD